MGESIVGAYLRHVYGCQTVAYNTYLPWGQGELDVIGVSVGPPVRVWLVEAAIHLNGLDYGGRDGYPSTVAKVRQKVAAARRYAAEVYPDAEVTVEFWAPNVASGLLSQLRIALADPVDGRLLADLVVNSAFSARLDELQAAAARTTKTTSEPAFRLLQILTHLRRAPAPITTDASDALR